MMEQRWNTTNKKERDFMPSHRQNNILLREKDRQSGIKEGERYKQNEKKTSR